MSGERAAVADAAGHRRGIARTFRSAVVAGTLAFPCGCLDGGPEADRRANGAGPVVVPVAGILLEETEQSYLGNPWSLVVDTADGSFLVSDFAQGRIIRFGRDGRVVQSYGRPGEGPGEFQGMGATFILNDSVVVGLDALSRLFKLFSREDGEYLESFRHRGRIGGAVSVVMGGSVLAWPDTMLVGMLGMNELYLATWEGEVLDTIHPPGVRRRGAPHDLHVKYDTDLSLSFKDRVEMMSLLTGIHRMSDGRTVLVHSDQTIRGEIPMVEWLADIYVTVLSADRRTACVDGSVPYANETRARLTASRDTLFLLDRALNETGDGLETWIRLYEIDTSGCRWLSAA